MSGSVSGGGFVTGQTGLEQVATPEDFTEEQQMIAETTRDFYKNEIEPHEERLEKLDYGLSIELMRKAGELGLLGADIPEDYGGLGLDKVSVALIMEAVSGATGFSATVSAHTGIGTLPIVFFGTAEQKRQYLPQLATGEKIAAYCLTEPSSGSDALSAKTTATLSEDGKHYILNGSKLFITNGGLADIFIVYAKIGGEHFSAFIVEKSMPGFSVGPEEKKMGIKASSTCPIYFDNVRVPAENLLGEAGKGHLIAFNILNIGRYKLAAGALGSAKAAIRESVKYANTRKQFNTAISGFPLIGKKLAEMNALAFALESVVYRTSGDLDRKLSAIDYTDPDAGNLSAAAIGEYAVECSINKVFASEALDRIADEAVQIHGGYGYISEYKVERIYRDSRINRIFEGTNEINRLIIPGTLLKRAAKGELPIMRMAEEVLDELERWQPAGAFEAELDEETYLVSVAKKMLLASIGYAANKYGRQLEKEQLALAELADMIIPIYVMESALLRTRKMLADGRPQQTDNALDMTRIIVHESFAAVHARAAALLTMLDEGDSLREKLGRLSRLAERTPIDTARLKRNVAERVIRREAYIV